MATKWAFALATSVILVAGSPSGSAEPAATASGATTTAPAPTDLTSVAGASRYLLSASTTRLFAGLNKPSRTIFMAALRPGGGAGLDALWSVLMTGALQTRRESADSGETLWFNPVFDAGLAVRWRRTAAGWTAVAVAPVLGEVLRGEPLAAEAADGRVAWPGRSPSLADALAVSQADSTHAAGQFGWTIALDATPAERALQTRVLIARVSRATLALRTMDQDPRYDTALHSVRRALVEGDASAGPLTERLERDLAAMGQAARLTLRPVAAIRRRDGWSVVLQSPDAVAVAFMAHFADPPTGGEAKPALFSEVPMLTLASAQATNPEAHR